MGFACAVTGSQRRRTVAGKDALLAPCLSVVRCWHNRVAVGRLGLGLLLKFSCRNLSRAFLPRHAGSDSGSRSIFHKPVAERVRSSCVAKVFRQKTMLVPLLR
jgi:hypothetical protein